jgi:predicted secreted protein
MKDIVKLNTDLKDKIVKVIEDFEKENGVELTTGIFYNYFSYINKKKEVHIVLGLKEI